MFPMMTFEEWFSYRLKHGTCTEGDRGIAEWAWRAGTIMEKYRCDEILRGARDAVNYPSE